MKKLVLTFCLMAWVTGYLEVPLSQLRIHKGGNCYVLDAEGKPVISNAVILRVEGEKALLHVLVPEKREKAVESVKGFLAWTKADLLKVKPELGGTKTINTDEGPVEVSILPEHNYGAKEALIKEETNFELVK